MNNVTQLSPQAQGQSAGLAGLAGDVRSLDGLRARAASDPKASIRETAKAFETLFMQEVMKSMRAASLSTGMLDNEGSQLGTELLDQQFASRMAGLPGGLSDMIARQLERQLGLSSPSALSGLSERANPAALPLNPVSGKAGPADSPTNGANGTNSESGATV